MSVANCLLFYAAQQTVFDKTISQPLPIGTEIALGTACYPLPGSAAEDWESLFRPTATEPADSRSREPLVAVVDHITYDLATGTSVCSLVPKNESERQLILSRLDTIEQRQGNRSGGHSFYEPNPKPRGAFNCGLHHAGGLGLDIATQNEFGEAIARSFANLMVRLGFTKVARWDGRQQVEGDSTVPRPA